MDLEALWGLGCYVIFSTPSKAKTWFDYSRSGGLEVHQQNVVSSDQTIVEQNVFSSH